MIHALDVIFEENIIYYLGYQTTSFNQENDETHPSYCPYDKIHKERLKKTRSYFLLNLTIKVVNVKKTYSRPKFLSLIMFDKK